MYVYMTPNTHSRRVHIRIMCSHSHIHFFSQLVWDAYVQASNFFFIVNANAFPMSVMQDAVDMLPTNFFKLKAFNRN